MEEKMSRWKLSRKRLGLSRPYNRKNRV
ncbi:hypothetical protein PBCVAN69C_683R [Paramecium bursaria Chlorella virus AN69C]|nr:hypothetical protein PBCVAN69C_683R [Paramecium bursaria Chlorella virus AN69C]